MTVLLGLNGRRGAGKDTAFSYIQEWAAERGLHAARAGFADLLKLSFARLFLPDCTIDEAIQWCDELKIDSDLEITWVRKDNYETITTIAHHITGRQALQRFGTEGHRQVFGDDFWVDALLPLSGVEHVDEKHSNWYDDYRKGPKGTEPIYWQNFMNGFMPKKPDICVVTDLRYENEARRIHELGGQIWEVHRGGMAVTDSHSSEEPLPVSLITRTIYNSAEGDPGQMRKQIRVAMDPFREDLKEETRGE